MKDKITVLFIEQGVAFGGSLVVIANLVRCLDPEKFRSVVVAEMDEEIVQHHIKGMAKIYIAKHNFNYVLWEKLTERLQRIQTKLIRKAGLYFISAIRGMTNSLYAIKLAMIMLRERVDLVHINNGTHNLEANLISLLFAKSRIVHIHGVGQVGTLEKLFLKAVPKVIVISEFVKSSMAQAGIPEDQMLTIVNPVLPDAVPSGARERVRKKYGLDNDAMIFGIFGRVVEWKGQKEFLQAAVQVIKAIPQARALIIGDASDGGNRYLRELHQFAAKHGIKDKVIFTGYVSNVAELYTAMDVVVHTSIEPEPFGLVITEAMAYGVPVVASTLGAPREIIHDGVDGFLVHPADTEKLASTIINLLRNDELRKGMGTLAKQEVMIRYDANVFARAFEQVYLQVLGR